MAPAHKGLGLFRNRQEFEQEDIYREKDKATQNALAKGDDYGLKSSEQFILACALLNCPLNLYPGAQRLHTETVHTNAGDLSAPKYVFDPFYLLGQEPGKKLSEKPQKTVGEFLEEVITANNEAPQSMYVPILGELREDEKLKEVRDCIKKKLESPGVVDDLRARFARGMINAQEELIGNKKNSGVSEEEVKKCADRSLKEFNQRIEQLVKYFGATPQAKIREGYNKVIFSSTSTKRGNRILEIKTELQKIKADLAEVALVITPTTEQPTTKQLDEAIANEQKEKLDSALKTLKDLNDELAGIMLKVDLETRNLLSSMKKLLEGLITSIGGFFSALFTSSTKERAKTVADIDVAAGVIDNLLDLCEGLIEVENEDNRKNFREELRGRHSRRNESTISGKKDLEEVFTSRKAAVLSLYKTESEPVEGKDPQNSKALKLIERHIDYFQKAQGMCGLQKRVASEGMGFFSPNKSSLDYIDKIEKELDLQMKEIDGYLKTFYDLAKQIKEKEPLTTEQIAAVSNHPSLKERMKPSYAEQVGRRFNETRRSSEEVSR